MVEYHNFHLDCGMLGMRYIFHALNMCGKPEYAFKIIKSSGYPGYAEWIKNGATTLWETWQGNFSKNHHMFSDVLSWMIQTILGISPQIEYPAYKHVEISPQFFDSMTYATGSVKTLYGKIRVEWKRKCDNVVIHIEIPKDIKAEFKWHDFSRELTVGDNEIFLKTTKMTKGSERVG